MIAWRKMETPVLLILLMLGFVMYVGLGPIISHVSGPVLPLNLQPVQTPAAVVMEVANPVEQVMVPAHSVWAP